LKKVKRKREGTSKMNRSKKIEFVKLEKTSSISLTGSYCSFNCNHCNGHYLKNMSKIKDMNDLIKQGINSFLISGGLMKDGKIPIGLFENKLYNLKKTYGLKYNFHTGYMDYEDIPYLKELADVVSYDLIGDKETMVNVYGHDFFDKSWDIFFELLENGINVKPHITIGLNNGQITHEFKAVEKLTVISENIKNLSDIIFLVFIPTNGTKFANENPPDVEKVKSFMTKVRERCPDKVLILGCMQPKGVYRAKLQESLLGIVDKIVQPINNTIKKAIDMNYEIEYSYECCAF